MDIDDGTLRSGFELVRSYKEHKSAIRLCVYNKRNRTYLSVDERFARLWKYTGQELAMITFPAGQKCFITDVVYVAEHNLFFATALDRTLKIYDERLNIISSLPWTKDHGLPAQLLYNPKQDEVITAGLGGIKVWEACLDGKRKLVPLVGSLPGQEAPPPPDYSNPLTREMSLWKQRRRVNLLKRIECKLPFGKLEKQKDEEWVCNMYLNKELELLFVPWAANLYVYFVGQLPRSRGGKRKDVPGDQLGDTDFVTMEPRYIWTGLHDQPITAVTMHVVPNHTRGGSLVITGSRDSKVKVWQQKSQLNKISYMRNIGSHTKTVSSLRLHKSSNAVISTSLDGSVQMWSLESYEPMHRAKLSSSVLGLDFVDSSNFYLHTEKEVKIFKLIHLHDTFVQYNSPVIGLQSVDNKTILLMCEDSSTRLVHNESGESLSTTVPQLSTKSLVAVQYSKEKRRLYVLLAHGEIHVYSTKTNPSSRVEVWSTTMKERVSCMELCHAAQLGMDQAAAGEGMLAEDGREVDTLQGEMLVRLRDQASKVCGTHDGDIWWIETAGGGVMKRRVQSHRNVAIKAIKVAADIKIMATLGDPKGISSVKLWRLEPQGVVFLQSIHYNEIVTCINRINHTLITGHLFGSVRMIDLLQQAPLAVPQAGDHSAKVTDIKVNTELQHFLTCSLDGTVKVFDAQKRLESALAMESPIACVCYLNNSGDIVAGFGDRLIAIRATLYINHRKKREELAELRDAYAFMMEEDERAVPTEALLKLKNMKIVVERFSEHGDTSSGEEEDERGGSSSDEEDAHSCVDVQLATDSLWGPSNPRASDNPKNMSNIDWQDTLDAETMERLHAQLVGGGSAAGDGRVVPLLKLPGQPSEKVKKKKKKKRKKGAAKPTNEYQVISHLSRRRNGEIAFGLQEYKAFSSLTSHISLLPTPEKKKGAEGKVSMF